MEEKTKEEEEVKAKKRKQTNNKTKQNKTTEEAERRQKARDKERNRLGTGNGKEGEREADKKGAEKNKKRKVKNAVFLLFFPQCLHGTTTLSLSTGVAHGTASSIPNAPSKKKSKMVHSLAKEEEGHRPPSWALSSCFFRDGRKAGEGGRSRSRSSSSRVSVSKKVDKGDRRNKHTLTQIEREGGGGEGRQADRG